MRYIELTGINLPAHLDVAVDHVIDNTSAFTGLGVAWLDQLEGGAFVPQTAAVS